MSDSRRVSVRRCTFRRLVALACAGRTPEEIAVQMRLPLAVVTDVEQQAGWPSLPVMRESLARVDALSHGRRPPWRVSPVGVARLGSGGLDSLVNATATTSDPDVIDAIAELQIAASRLMQVAVRPVYTPVGA